MSSDTKEVLTLTSVKLEHFLLNHEPLWLFYSLLTAYKTNKPKDTVALRLLNTIFPLLMKSTAKTSMDFMSQSKITSKARVPYSY